MRYQETRLWKDAFANTDDGTAKRLEAEYAKAWDKACAIAKRITADAPGLTLHDEAHFRALWRAADLLVPKDVTLSATEAFIFGVAILIHDAAHTVLAYKGGLEALSKTEQWKDNLVSRHGELAPDAPLPDVKDLPEDMRRAVVFDTVRALHAEAAPELSSKAFDNKITGQSFYLLDDWEIRRHMGKIIGEIAASHHWNLAKVANLQATRNLVAPFSAFGPVRVMLLAALMRTADAIQIDGARAPDFEFAITRPQGISALHWTAQNSLATNIDAKDGEALAIDSTVAFVEAQAKAWWIAYELAKVADKELRETDALLRDKGQPRLQLRRVRDIETPERFAKHVETEGWEPVSAEVKIGDTARLIEMFGGSQLYGDDKTVPLRELIQNAVDAVRARRLLEPGYQGKVTVELEAGTDDQDKPGYWLRVKDDGIGMSPAIMTGPFLTFGESGWSSATLQKERPGFRAKRFDHIGRYGIGFFSVFMISENIHVTSRPYSEGLSAAKTLQFSAGLGLRPLLKTASGGTMAVVTGVEAFISSDIKENILYKSAAHTKLGSEEEVPAQAYKLSELLGMLCPMIDVDIDAFEHNHGTSTRISGDWLSCDPLPWLSRILGINRESIHETIVANPDLVEIIGSPDKPIGRAALNPLKPSLGKYAISGFGAKDTDRVRHTNDHLVGCINHAPAGPRRVESIPIEHDSISIWASGQVHKWAKVDLTGEQKNFIAANAASFRGDPSPVANARIDGKWLSIEEIYCILKNSGPIYAPIHENLTFSQPNEYVWTIRESVNISGFNFKRDEIEIELQNVLVAGETSNIHFYWALPESEGQAEFSFISILARYCQSMRKTLRYEGQMMDFGYYCGETIKSLRRTHGDRINIPGIKIEIVDADA